MSKIPKVGDVVGWVSESGNWVEKVGKVVQVVPAEEVPSREIAPDLFTEAVVARSCESYIVRVKSGPTASFRHLWLDHVTALSESWAGMLESVWDPKPLSPADERALEEDLAKILGKVKPH